MSTTEVAILLGSLLSALVYCGVPRVTVRNSSAVTLTDVSFSGNGFARHIDALAPDASHTFWFVPDGDTSVHFGFRALQRPVEGGKHGYYMAPPRPQMPGALTVDRELRTDFRRSSFPRFRD